MFLAHSWFATSDGSNELGPVYPFQLKQGNSCINANTPFSMVNCENPS